MPLERSIFGCAGKPGLARRPLWAGGFLRSKKRAVRSTGW